MKPLPVAPITKEDWDVLNFVTLYHVRRHGFDFTNQLDRASIAADRRDAELMHQAQHNRWAPLWDGNRRRLPPWLLPITFDCGPVGGDIEGYA